MQPGPAHSIASHARELATFATRPLPPRVRSLVEGLYKLMAGELERGLLNTLSEYENQLFGLAEQARSNGVQMHYFEALKEVRQNGAGLVPAFMKGLEAALASVRDAPVEEAVSAVVAAPRGGLALVDEVDMDERILINEIAGRAEMRCGLPLFLLGQRYGVLAARPGFDAEHLPIGPAALCRIAAQAAGCMSLSNEHRQLLLRQFDKQVVQLSASLYEVINSWLAEQGVLPNITYVPFRARPQAQQPASPRARRDATPAAPATDVGADGDARQERPESHSHEAEPAAARPSVRPGALPPAQSPPRPAQSASTAPGPVDATPVPAWPEIEPPKAVPGRWPGMPSVAPVDEDLGAPADSVLFDTLRHLLASRRSLAGKFAGRAAGPSGPTVTATPEDVQTVLDRMQHLQTAPVMKQGKASMRTVAHLKQDMLMQLRTGQADGAAVALPEEENDTIELVGMLVDHLMKDLKPASPAAGLLTKLQIPLLRVALSDRSFFSKTDHPARLLLNSVAETSDWFSSDDPADKAMIERMRLVVDRVVSEFTGDMALFENLLGDVNQHLQVQVKRAEVAERRHVEAARGKEKLELARIQAAQTVEKLTAGRKVPKFAATLLNQSWSDVLALSLLRHGPDSAQVKHQIEIAQRLIASAERRASAEQPVVPQIDAEVQTLRGEIEEGLLQVGYHAEDAQAVSTRLTAASGNDDAEDDSASRTELSLRLKQRTRFGQDVDAQAADDPGKLTAAERAEYQKLKCLPFGSWFEFDDPAGGTTRRRMSWYSPMTGHSLFVNHRGQRVGEFHLTFLAREMVAGRIRVMADNSTSLVDKAWKAIVGALRSFAGKPAEAGA